MDTGPGLVEAYIEAAAPEARPALYRIRDIVRRAAPNAAEIISYRMPAFRGRRILIYFAAFKNHIGIFPPVDAGPALNQALAPYRGPKGNLRFALDQPIPFDIIARLVRLRVRQDQAPAPVRKGPPH